MLPPNSSFLFVAKTKTGQKTVQKDKVLKQKSTGKELHPVMAKPQIEKQLTEEERIIQAAERYHQQISGKKVAAPADKKTSFISKQTATTNNAGEGKDNVAQRDLTVNIYTGNPGIYVTEGDTLNFWSFSAVPVDSLASKEVIAEQPPKPYGFAGKPLIHDGQDWTFFLILIGWTIFASLRFGFSKYLVMVFQSVFNYSISSRLYREQGYNNNFGPFRLNLIFYLFLPLPVYLIARENGVSLMGFSGIELYLIVLVVINAYFLLKIFLYKLLGSVFSLRETTGELVFNMMLFHNVLGIILLPISTIHSMVPGFGIVSLFAVPALIAIFYLMSIIRSIYFAFREGISIFYLILYLCALEILPVLLVIKLATGG
jgi:hypothetical protein